MRHRDEVLVLSAPDVDGQQYMCRQGLHLPNGCTLEWGHDILNRHVIILQGQGRSVL